jgi:hypothetical protein
MDNRELLYRNQFINEREDNIQSDDSSDESSDDDSEKTLIVKKNLQTILFIVNSKDRAWRGTNFVSDPNTFNYTVKFAPTSDTGGFSGQSELAHFLINVKDIVSIEFIHLILPNIYLDLDTLHSLNDSNFKIITSSKDQNTDSRNIRFPRISDLPYISLVIQEIGTTVAGTNSLLNNTTAIFVPDDIKEQTNNNSGKYSNTSINSYEYNNLGKSIVSDSIPSLIKFLNITPWKKLYYPNPKSSINLLNISFFDPDGNQLKLLDNYLDIHSICLTNTENSGEIIELVSTTYTAESGNAWQTSQTDVTVSSSNISTNNDGTSPTVVISTSSDGLTITATITGGSGFLESDALTITDPGSTTNTAIFFVKHVTGKAIGINTKTYFSPEEYRIGTKILINNVQMKNLDYYDKNNLDTGALENFLNRSKGHLILGLKESGISTNTSRTNMFNQIQIPLEYILDKTTGKSTIKEDFKLKKNVIGKVGDLNTTTTVTLADTDDSTYYDIPNLQSDYYNDKTIIFTSGTSKDISTTITDFEKDSNNRLIATTETMSTIPAQNDKYRINMNSLVNSGRLINLNLQNTVSFKITTEKRDNSIFK